MFTEIVDTFKEIARCYENISGFYCNPEKWKGSGKDVYPLLHLDPDMIGQSVNGGAYIRYTLSFSVLRLTEKDNREDRLEAIGLSERDCINIVEAIKRMRLFGRQANVTDYSLMPLDYYSDDSASGCRCTMNFSVLNDTDLCGLEDYFDPEGQLIDAPNLPDFEVEDSGCLKKTFKMNFE